VQYSSISKMQITWLPLLYARTEVPGGPCRSGLCARTLRQQVARERADLSPPYDRRWYVPTNLRHSSRHLPAAAIAMGC